LNTARIAEHTAAAAAQKRRVDAAMKRLLPVAPKATFEYGPVTVVIRYIGSDGAETQIISEAARRAERVLIQAMDRLRGQVQRVASDSAVGTDIADVTSSAVPPTLIADLTDQLRFAAALGAVEILVK
jgi:hypothetical protein